MTKTIQLLRGTTAQNDAFTGAAGELTVDTTTNELRVHDGSTAGGHIIYTKSDVDTALSGKADTATTYTKTEVNNIASGKANVALDNLSSVGQNISNWSSNVTNCITNIPQDIKLELSSGTLTLKAGSKVYVPNGAGVFDEVVIENDISTTITNYGSQNNIFVFLAANQTSLTVEGGSNCYSGTTAPTGSTNMNWYDTTNNLLKRTNNSGSTWTSGLSLPISIITSASNIITSIDRVFNGCGHIGTAIFMLPGIKALIPNGLNPDGSYKNIAFTNPSVYVYDTPTDVERNVGFITDSTGTIIDYDNSRTDNTFVGLAQNRPTTVANAYNNYWYSTDENQWYNTSGSATANWQKAYPVFFGKRNGTATSTTYFEKKSDFSAADRDDREFFAHQAMPSGRYTNLTLGSSGSNYTAPSDGYFYLAKKSTAASQNISFVAGGIQTVIYATAAGQSLLLWVPATKGLTIAVWYSAAGTTNTFRFIYANGAS